MQKMSGALQCARYAFAPNFYHYCGPDKNEDLEGYIDGHLADPGLVENLAQFETLYPYLQAIAQASGVRDPLDSRVVEAYWVGNEFLDRVAEKDVYGALVEFQHLPKRLPKKELKQLLPKIDRRARLHHSFHVLNVFTRTGHHTVAHTVETMDQCRISWGEVLDLRFTIYDLRIKIKTQKLVYNNGKMRLAPAVKRVLVMEERLGKELTVGDFVSVHWGMVCERLSEMQVKRLQYYTDHHVTLANETL